VEGTYQLFDERGESDEVLFDREVELVPVLQVDRYFGLSVRVRTRREVGIPFSTSPNSSMVKRRPHFTSPPL
jgi:hypothetical protein